LRPRGRSGSPECKSALVAGSPTASKRSHLNHGFKVVSRASPSAEDFSFSWSALSRPPARRPPQSPDPARITLDARRTRRTAAPVASAIATAPTRTCRRRAHQRRPATCPSPARSGFRPGHRPRRRLLGNGWRDRPACLATRPASGVHLLPAGPGRRPSALRAVAPRRGACAQPFRHHRTRVGARSAAGCRADATGGDAAGGFRHPRTSPGDGRWLVRPHLCNTPRAHGATLAGGRRVRAPARRAARTGRLGRAARCRLHRGRHPRFPQGRCMSTHRRYWLMKSEPDAFSIDDLQRVGVEPWNGVRNYQARNFMRDGMRVGDGILFYHSNTKVPGIVGTATVASPAYPDDTQFDPRSHYHDPKPTREEPRWFLVDVAFERKLSRTIALDEIKSHADSLGDEFALIRRGNRLSVFPVSAAQYKFLLSLE